MVEISLLQEMKLHLESNVIWQKVFFSVHTTLDFMLTLLNIRQISATLKVNVGAV